MDGAGVMPSNVAPGADLRVIAACPPLLRYSIASLLHLQSPVSPVVIHTSAAHQTRKISRKYNLAEELFHSFKLVPGEKSIRNYEPVYGRLNCSTDKCRVDVHRYRQYVCW